MHEATETPQWERPTVAEPLSPPPQAEVDDVRTSIVGQAATSETMEQTSARLREERDSLVRAASKHLEDSTSGGQPEPPAVACFTERSTIELRQLLGQVGIEFSAQSPRIQLEQEYSRFAAAARANPRRVRDSAIKKCMICAADFGMRRRRRHCHCCGWVTCASCCSFTVRGLARHFNKDMQLVVTPQGSTDVSACMACKQAAVAP
eukprot:COSAG02_NODE_12019_length_1612_cov_1.508923_1_plen_206_part_00